MIGLESVIAAPKIASPKLHGIVRLHEVFKNRTGLVSEQIEGLESRSHGGVTGVYDCLHRDINQLIAANRFLCRRRRLRTTRDSHQEGQKGHQGPEASDAPTPFC